MRSQAKHTDDFGRIYTSTMSLLTVNWGDSTGTIAYFTPKFFLTDRLKWGGGKAGFRLSFAILSSVLFWGRRIDRLVIAFGNHFFVPTVPSSGFGWYPQPIVVNDAGK